MTLMVALAALTVDCQHAVPGVQLPTGQAAALVNDWRAVRNLDRGTHVLVVHEGHGILDGHVVAVSDADLELRGDGWQVSVQRPSVVRVIRVETMSGTYAKRGLVAGLFLSALLLISTHGALWPPALWDPPLFAAGGALSGLAEAREVLVYERP